MKSKHAGRVSRVNPYVHASPRKCDLYRNTLLTLPTLPESHSNPMQRQPCNPPQPHPLTQAAQPIAAHSTGRLRVKQTVPMLRFMRCRSKSGPLAPSGCLPAGFAPSHGKTCLPVSMPSIAKTATPLPPQGRHGRARPCPRDGATPRPGASQGTPEFFRLSRRFPLGRPSPAPQGDPYPRPHVKESVRPKAKGRFGAGAWFFCGTAKNSSPHHVKNKVA